MFPNFKKYTIMDEQEGIPASDKSKNDNKLMVGEKHLHIEFVNCGTEIIRVHKEYNDLEDYRKIEILELLYDWANAELLKIKENII